MLVWCRDPQPVQQDEGPDHDPGIEENYFSDYNTSRDIPGIAIDGPPSHLTFHIVISQRSPSPDPPLPHPNDSGVLASLHVDERVLTEAGLDDEDTELSIEAVAQPRFPLQFTPSLEGIHIPRCRALSFSSSSRKGWMHNIIIELHGYVLAFNAMSRNAVDVFRNGWIQGIQSHIF
ncbi:hypothetical protein EV424DRAFT_1601922 [Suillus variegatus]|nr:hypothetical protein EV424DRAFT_1601922 [Suillus variegatus]